MTVRSTDVRAKTKARPKLAPTNHDHRAQEKENTVARKVKLKASIDLAIEQIDDIIQALADEYSIGFAQASDYVHFAGRILKDRRRPSIQNAYRFCWARVEDGRCEFLKHFIAAVALTPLFSGTEADGGQIAEAVRIINNSKDNKDEYKSLSGDDQAILIALLQADRDKRDMGVVGKSQLRLHDIRTTIKKVNIEVCFPSSSH
jgi:hypothetical protein